MSFDFSSFDASSIPPRERTSRPFEDGLYPCVVNKSAMKFTKDGDGEYLDLDFIIVDGPREKSHIFSKLNLINRSAQAVEIGKASYADLLRSTGLKKINGPEDLVGESVLIYLRQKPSANGREEYSTYFREAEQKMKSSAQIARRDAPSFAGGSTPHRGNNEDPPFLCME